MLLRFISCVLSKVFRLRTSEDYESHISLDTVYFLPPLAFDDCNLVPGKKSNMKEKTLFKTEGGEKSRHYFHFSRGTGYYCHS